MNLSSQIPPVYLPETTQSTVLRLGLQRLSPSEWLMVDGDFGQFYRHKQECGRNQNTPVCRLLPESASAVMELRQLLLHHLTHDHSKIYKIVDKNLCYLPEALRWPLEEQSLWQTSLWVQDDLCIMERRGDEYHLTAASVCSPSNWRLEDKVGRSLAAIHAPVPGYGRTLGSRVERLFAGLRPDRPLLRYNWSVQHSPALLWRDDSRPAESGLSKQHERYWRVERQTLRKLPQTGAVVFTIRIFLHSFSELAGVPGFREDIEALLQRLPADQRRYKGLD